MDTGVEQAAQRLLDADSTRTPCAPVRDLLGRDDVDRAYAVQRLLRASSEADGRRVSGHKIGLTSPRVQAQLGVDRPDFGVLHADMEVSGTVDTGRLLQPRIEAEVAVVLGRDLDGLSPDDAPGRVAGAVASVVAALEIVDSRIAGWDISFADTVADNASSGLYVLGERKDPSVFGDDLGAGLAALTMTMTRDGEAVSSGTGADCLGSPLAALTWLALTAARLGDPLRAGEIVLTGALGPMVPVTGGDTFHARVEGLGEVGVAFSA